MTAPQWRPVRYRKFPRGKRRHWRDVSQEYEAAKHAPAKPKEPPVIADAAGTPFPTFPKREPLMKRMQPMRAEYRAAKVVNRIDPGKPVAIEILKRRAFLSSLGL